MKHAVPDCDPEDIRRELHRIISCPRFEASDRNRRFLEYVVEETLQGRADRIKAYSIATSVFGRNDSFDPQQDAIVRIEASRMRRSLAHYYLTAGRGDPVRIAIPVGSYVPVFLRTLGIPSDPGLPDQPAPAPPERRHGAARRPVICVADFAAEGDGPGTLRLARGLSRRVIVGLTRFTDLAVVGGAAAPDLPGSAVDPAALRADRGADFLLTGAAALAGDRVWVEALLLDLETGQYIWSDGIERQGALFGAATLGSDIADHIVRAVAQPTGAIFSHMANGAPVDPPETGNAFDSVVRFHSFWRSFDPAGFEPVRLGLERAISADPHCAEAFACLSQMYSCSLRPGYMGIATSLNPQRRALALAQRAVQLSPRSARSYLALATAYWSQGQVSCAMEALETSRSLNPNDMEILAELGLRHALRANWDAGVPLILQAYSRTPALPVGYRIGLSLWHFCEGRSAEALCEASKIDMPGVICPSLLVAIAAAKLGRRKEAEAALNSLLALDPHYGRRVVSDLEGRCMHPDVIAKLVRGLREAGLPCRNLQVRPGLARASAGQSCAAGAQGADDGKDTSCIPDLSPEGDAEDRPAGGRIARPASADRPSG